MTARARRQQGPFLILLLLVFIVGAVMFACSSPCFAENPKPPTDEEVDEWIDAEINNPEADPNDEVELKVLDTIKMYEPVSQTYWLFVTYENVSLREEDYTSVGYFIGVWQGAGDEDVESIVGGLNAGFTLEEGLAEIEGLIEEDFDNHGLEQGWPMGSPDGEVISPESNEGEGGKTEEGQVPESGSKIPGPGSWWEWLTGTVVAGAIAAGIGLVNTLFGAAPPPSSLINFDGPMPPPTDLAGGTADPFNTQKYPNQPAYIGDAISENLDIAKDAAGQTVVDTGVALKDGVVGFVKGVASIPITALEGFVQIGRLIAVAHDDATSGRPSILSDLGSRDVRWDTLKNIWDTLGKEVLPIEEVKSFFDPHASLEEKLWAIPSAAVKLANLILMSEKLATKPVPGLPANFTLIKSAKPGLAAEAALHSTDPGVQKQYEAYKAAGEAKAAGIKETVDKGGKVTQEQVLDAMSDPATMRNIKSAPQAVQKEFNLTQAKEVYKPVYEDVTGFMKGKNPNGKYRVGGVRTPGQKSLINTDNDVIVEELVKTRDGTPYWKEVPAKEWEGAYYDSFAKRTGFDPAKAKARFPEKNWDSMSLEGQHKAWTEGHGQEAMDVKNPEAAHAFSNQPTVMDPKWKPGGKSPVADGRMVDGEGLGHMESFKTQKGWSGGAINSTTETMEQGCKLCNLSKKLAAQSMKRTGKTITYPEVFKQGEEILNMRNLAPAVRDKALQNLGFRGGYEEFMQKLSGWTGALP